MKSFLPHVKISNNEKKSAKRKINVTNHQEVENEKCEVKIASTMFNWRDDAWELGGWIIGIFFLVSLESSEPSFSEKAREAGSGRQKNENWSGWDNTYFDRETEDTNHIMTKVKARRGLNGSGDFDR